MGKVWQAMTKAHQRMGRDGLAELVENVWVELDGPAAVASNSSTAGVANCRSYLDILARAEQGLPEDTLVKAEMLLQNAYAPPDPGAAPSPVELMTVHRAKGEPVEWWPPFSAPLSCGEVTSSQRKTPDSNGSGPAARKNGWVV
jgi:hypothetical protein